MPACAPVLSPPEEEDEDVGEALASAGLLDVVVPIEEDKSVVDDAAAVEGLVLEEEVAEMTPMVAASSKVAPDVQQLLAASSPQHHDPSGHRLNRALPDSPYYAD
jgi:hypothetical protein